MQFTSVVLLASIAARTIACPGQEAAMANLKAKLDARAADTGDSFELLGDLATKGATTPVGSTIKDLLTGGGDPESSEVFLSTLWPKGSSQCAADTCCIWKWVALDMEKKFRGTAGRCNGFARAAVRLGFHDAGAWSKTTGYGGADGSFVLANEITRPENNGLQEITTVMQGWYNTYHQYGVGMADLIQMGATVATVVCPLGPRIRSYVGRKDSSKPNADGLLPSVFSDADTLIDLFKNKTIYPHGLAALVGAHTTSQQRFVDTTRAYDPQDSTPGVWDVTFYGQTIGTTATPKRVFKFPSDVKLAAHPAIADEWKEFAGTGGQDYWNEDFAREYIRLSLLGVNNINDLKECTKVLPARTNAYTAPDQAVLNQWLAGGLSTLGKTVEDATTLISSLLSALGIHLRRDVVM